VGIGIAFSAWDQTRSCEVLYRASGRTGRQFEGTRGFNTGRERPVPVPKRDRHIADIAARLVGLIAFDILLRERFSAFVPQGSDTSGAYI
jgi:hypothetical protein